MSQEFIDYMKKSFAQAEGDLYEAVYWVWDAVNKEHGRAVRKVLYGDERMRRISRLDFKNFFAMVYTAMEEFKEEKNAANGMMVEMTLTEGYIPPVGRGSCGGMMRIIDDPTHMEMTYAEKNDDVNPSMKLDFASQAADLSPQALFDVPPIVVAKVSKAEFVDMLRDRVNGQYMPSSSRTGCNSKPEYVQVISIDSFRRQLARETCPGFYTANDDIYAMSRVDVGLWAVVPVSNQSNLFVNLSTDSVYIGTNNGEYMVWTKGELALDREKLKDTLDRL